jgi:signal transduction histidine kinase
VATLVSRLAQDRPPSTAEVRIQNRELLETLESLRLRDLELEKRHAETRRINSELEETNRGVVALYAELDEKAVALRGADELKGRFLSHVSHEFRTSLNSILALAQLLLRRTDGELTPEQERQVGYIRKAAQDLTEIVNDLLDLAKVEAGKTEVHSTRMHLRRTGSVSLL